MATTWFVIAHRAGARILEQRGRASLTLSEEIAHPEGRLRSGEIDTDSPGSAFESSRAGVRAMTGKVSAHEQVAHNFARELAQNLRDARNEARFDKLVLVAEPHFLGLLRRALDVPTASRVEYTINRDLAHVPMRSLEAHLNRARGRA